MAAGRAVGHRDGAQLATVVADLDRRFTVAVACLLWRLHRGNRTVGGHHASKVQHQAVVGVAFDPHPSACHLNVQAGAHGGAQHGDQVNVRVVKSGGQDIGVGQGEQTASLKVGKHSLAFLLRRFTRYAVSGNAVLL